MPELSEVKNTFGNMHYYKATLQYDGTGYAGFQWQKEIPSIQNDFNHAIKSLVPGKITTMGASRTDTGVHAIEIHDIFMTRDKARRRPELKRITNWYYCMYTALQESNSLHHYPNIGTTRA